MILKPRRSIKTIKNRVLLVKYSKIFVCLLRSKVFGILFLTLMLPLLQPKLANAAITIIAKYSGQDLIAHVGQSKIPNCVSLTSATALDRIGIDCLIKLPNDCDLDKNKIRPASPLPGVNCIKKTQSFADNSLKHRGPFDCSQTTASGGARIHGENCVRSDLPYCHNVSDPILAVNCRLAPCMAIPNTAIRRPGINCLADCNGDSGIVGDDYYYEGFNCLTKCTERHVSAKTNGLACVYEFQKFVAPLCQPVGNTPKFMLANMGGNAVHRKDCVDLIDLPFCSLTAFATPPQIDLISCTRKCDTPGITSPTSNQNCLDFATAANAGSTFSPQYCHIFGSSGSEPCTRLSCNLLTAEELKASGSNSNNNFCNPLGVSCSALSKEQLASAKIGIHCDAIQCSCTGGSAPSFDIQKMLNIDSYYSQVIATPSAYTNAYNLACGGQTLNYSSPPCCKPAVCPSTNATQTFACETVAPTVAGGSVTYKNNVLCDNPTATCANGQDGTCTKTGINCQDPANMQKYSVCRSTIVPISGNNADPYVSWFFRPTPHDKALTEINQTFNRITAGTTTSVTEKRKTLRQMSGCPITGGSCTDDDIYYTLGDLRANGFGRCTGAVIGNDCPMWYHDYGLDDTRSPGVQATRSGVIGVGYLGVCGMKGLPSNKPDDDFGYFAGGVKVNYTKNGPEYEVSLCVRRTNTVTGIKSSCGRRECGIVAYADSAFIQNIRHSECGTDICKTLKVNGDGCIMNDALFKEDLMNVGFNPASIATLGMTFGSINSPCKKRLSDDPISGDNSIRIRAYKPKFPESTKNKNYICAAMDIGNINASGGNAYNGKEEFELEDGEKACVSGIYNKSAKACEGVDTSQYPNMPDDGQGHVLWRTVKHFRYIGNVDKQLVDDPNNEYTSKIPGIVGRVNFSTPHFFKKSDCIRYPLRVPPPKQHNVLTLANSPSAFTPALYIIRSCVRKDSTCAQQGFKNSPTDFYEPMIEVGFGNDAERDKIGSLARKLISIDFNSETSVTTNSGGQKVYTSLATPLGGIAYNAEVYLRKEGDGQNPVVCLYRKTKDVNGMIDASEDNDQQIGCIERTKPEFDNETGAAEGTPLRKVLIMPLAADAYDKFSLNVRYLYSSATNYLSSSSNAQNRKSASCPATQSATGPVFCSDEQTIILEQNKFETSASIGKEGFWVKIEREPCSKLNFECVKAQLNLNDKVRKNLMMPEEAEKNSDKLECLNLLGQCNDKKGISADFNPSKISGFNKSSKDNFYGWFNEICITSGFEEKLNRSVVAYKVANGQLGKCIIDQTKKSSIVTCGQGGNEKAGCPCMVYIAPDPEIAGSGTKYDAATQTVRKITPHEASLCVEIPVIQSCAAIKFPPINSDKTNPYFVSESDLAITYVDTTTTSAPTCANPDACTLIEQAKIAHYARSQNNPKDVDGYPTSSNPTHAEFGIALAGENDVYGTCNGFWKNQDSLGIAVNPLANCSTEGKWTNFRNPCIRYTCQARETAIYGSDAFGLYPGYDISGAHDQLGRGNGFANWSSHTKINDNKESKAAKSCLVGYRPSGSAVSLRIASYAVPNQPAIELSLSGATADELVRAQYRAALSAIKGFSGGNLPTRQCTQLGQWDSVQNPCQRITCPGTDNISISADYLNVWRKIGGIVIPSNVITPASRNSFASANLSESWAEGTCLASLGYSPLSSNAKPRLYCDHNGNWSKMQNPCQRSCDTINSAAGDDIGHGYGTWAASSGSIGDLVSVSRASSCTNNRFANPYPPRLDYEGEKGKAIETATASGNFILGTRTQTAVGNYLPENTYNSTASGLTYTNPSGQNKSIIKMSIGVGASGVSNTNTERKVMINLDGVKYEIKRVEAPVLNGLPTYRSPLIGELEQGKTYILEKVINGADTFYVAYLGFYKKLASDSTYSGGSFTPTLPSRTCRPTLLKGGFNSWSAPNSICVNGCIGGGSDIGRGEDDRIGAGVTEHDHSSFPSGKILVKWDAAPFGNWQLKQFKAVDPKTKYAIEDSQTQTASDYNISTRTNGKFALARYCNPQTRKWDSPIVVCMANDGVVDPSHKATVETDLNGISNTKNDVIDQGVMAGKNIFGKCNVAGNGGNDFEYNWENGSYNLQKLQYTCSIESGSAVDKYYFKKTGGMPCIQTCTTQTGASSTMFGNSYDANTYSNSLINGVNYAKKFRNGDKLTLKCKAGYGRRIAATERNISSGEDLSDLCGLRVGMKTRRVSASELPTTTCIEGKWQAVLNQCDKCKSCKFSDAPTEKVHCNPRCNQKGGCVNFGLFDICTPITDDSCWSDNYSIRDVISTWKSRNGVSEDSMPDGTVSDDYFKNYYDRVDQYGKHIPVFSFFVNNGCGSLCVNQSKSVRPKVKMRCDENGTWIVESKSCDYD